MFDNLVKLDHDIFVLLDGCDNSKYEAFFYFACYTLGQHKLADQTLFQVDDPDNCADVAIRAWTVAYCRLGKKAAKKVTTPKAKKIFSQHLDTSGGFIETGVPRLWLSVDDREIRERPHGTAAVIIACTDKIALMPYHNIPEHTIFTQQDLLDLQTQILAAARQNYP